MTRVRTAFFAGRSAPVRWGCGGERGREQPPASPAAVPRPARRVAHAPARLVLVSVTTVRGCIGETPCNRAREVIAVSSR
jgi:hypothetical protein